MQQKQKHTFTTFVSIPQHNGPIFLKKRIKVYMLTEEQAMTLRFMTINALKLYDYHAWLYHNEELVFDNLADYDLEND